MTPPKKMVLMIGVIAAAGCSQPSASPGSGSVDVAPDTEQLASAVARGAEQPEDQPLEATRFFLAQRLGAELATYPIDAVYAELGQLRTREAALAQQREGRGQRGGASGADWIELGPGNIGGRTRALVIDPDEPDIMYAAGVSGGIWKTTDRGASWRPLDDFMLNLAVSTLAMDSADSHVLYAGTGEGFADYDVDTYIRGLGIFKSEDAGETWNLLESTREGAPDGAFDYVNKIVVSPNDSARVYAATRFGVWRSVDGGASWSIVLANPRYVQTPPTSQGCSVGCTDLAIQPNRDPDTLFAAFGSFEQDGLFRSSDGGDNWTGYTTNTNQGRMTLAFAPSDENVLYLLMADNGQGGQLGQLVQIYRSTTGGASFEARVDLDSRLGPWLLSHVSLASGCAGVPTYSQGWHDSALAVDPLDPDVVWVGGVDMILRSDDGGRTFGGAGSTIRSDPLPPYWIHADHHSVVFPPDYDGAGNQTMFATNDGGLFRTDNARALTSQEDCYWQPDEPLPEVVWTSMNNDYRVTQFYHGDSARDIDMFIGGTQDNGTNRAMARNTPNAWRRIFGGDGGYVAIDPTDADTIYVEYQGFPTIMKSTDGGANFVSGSTGITDTDGLFIAPFAMDQSNPQVLWTGGRRPWRTTNGAAQWEAVGPDFGGPATISAIAIAPSDSNVVYLGFTNGFAVRSTNALAPNPGWVIRSNGLPPGWVSSMAVDPDDPDVAYATYSTFGIPHVWRTRNGGASWQSIDGIAHEEIPDIPVHWIVVRPCDAQHLFAGTELGVFASVDGGTTWDPANEGLAHVVVETLDFQRDHTLVAFTHGRGAFLRELGTTCASCPGDVDGTGRVDFEDLLAVLAAWGPCPIETACRADIDGSGRLDFADMVAVLAGWGDCP